MSRRIIYICLLLFCLLPACHPLPEHQDSPSGNFEALWRVIDEHYCFFEEKDIDWREIHDRYAPMVREDMTQRQLFSVCAAMLDELRDGHTNLSAPFATSYYRGWWSDYPQNFDLRLVEQYYFNFNYQQLGDIFYGILPSNVGYMRVPSFTVGIGHGNIDYILNYFNSCAGLIIDVRDNGGGNLSYAEVLASHFIPETTTVGYIMHKTGPGHDDFSEPFAIEYSPAPLGNVLWARPVVLLTNRSTFSAANFFVAVLRAMPNVTVAGATTGGGSGMPYSSELPCGWGVRMSAVSILDHQGRVTESGIEPDKGCAVGLDAVAALDGHDTMIDFAVKLITR